MSAERESGTTLAPELRALLEAERARPAPPDALRERVFSRLAVAIPGLGGPGGGSEGPPSDGATVEPAPSAATPLPRVASFVAKLSASAPVAISAFVAGIIAGAGGHAALTGGSSEPTAAPPAVIVDPAQPAPASAEEPLAPPAPEPSPEIAIEAAPTPVPRARSRAPSTLAAERALLEPARSALVRGEPQRALEWLERHRSRHPDGSLAEEREVLAVQALVRLDSMDEARERAARFRSRYPHSLFEPAISAALSSIP